MGKLGSLVDGLLLDIGFTKLRTAGTAYSNFNHRYFRSSFVFVVEFIVYHRFYRSIEEKLKILTFFFFFEFFESHKFHKKISINRKLRFGYWRL